MTTLTERAPATLPRHIGFIADGNRRWARAHATTLEQGFRHGALAVHQVLEDCRTRGIETASVFLMSDRNFHRDSDEVAVLNDVLADLVDTEAAAVTGPIRILTNAAVIDHYASPRLLEAMTRAVESTADRDGMTVCMGIGYDGRADIHAAVRAAQAEHGPNWDIALGDHLATAGLPDPDLIVRTSGERRLSGFLLYQAADATLHFDPRYWPDYDRQALDEALAVHAEQRRTFGH